MGRTQGEEVKNGEIGAYRGKGGFRQGRSSVALQLGREGVTIIFKEKRRGKREGMFVGTVISTGMTKAKNSRKGSEGSSYFSSKTTSISDCQGLSGDASQRGIKREKKKSPEGRVVYP